MSGMTHKEHVQKNLDELMCNAQRGLEKLGETLSKYLNTIHRAMFGEGYSKKELETENGT